jgi:hypothetical protein
VRSSPVKPGRMVSAAALKSTTSPPPGRTAAASAATNVRVPVGVEVAEAVAHADGGVEAVGRDVGHVGLGEGDVDARRRGGAPGVLDRFGGDVEAGHGVAAAGEPSSPATHQPAGE